MHTIRLRGPWQLTGCADDPAATIKLPVSISNLKSQIGQTFTLDRSFNRPSGLDASQEVFLAVETPLKLQRVMLNSVSFEPPSSLRLPIRHLLDESNRLSLTLVRTPAAEAASALEVRLEIEDPR